MSSLGKLWRAKLEECLSSLSPITKRWPKVSSAEHFLSQRGKSHKSPSPSVARCCRKFSVSRQHSVLSCSRTGMPGFPRAFGVCLCEQELLAVMHKLKLLLGHADPLFTSFGFYMAKAPVVSTHQHGLDLLLWGYFALNLGCVCSLHSKNKD